MAHPELKLISNLIKHGDFSQILKKRVTPALFETEEGKTLFKWMWDQYHHPDHRGEVASLERLQKRFPQFDYKPSRDSVEALILDMKRDRLNSELSDIIEEMGALVDEDEDPALILAAALQGLRDLNAESQDDDGMLLSNSIDVIKQEYETMSQAGGLTGLPWPWEPVNRATGGIQPEELVIVYARPKTGKTWLAVAIAAHAYGCANARVLVYSKEMSKKAMLRRCASVICDVDYAKLKSGSLSDDERDDFYDALDSIKAMERDANRTEGRKPAMLFISDKKRAEGTVDSLMARAEKFKPDLIIVDGFYLMTDGRTKTKKMSWDTNAHITQDLKGMAQQLEVAVIGTTQANRSGADSPTTDMTDVSFGDGASMDGDLLIRAFRGPNPEGKGACVAMTFPGMREAQLNPFLIKFNPGQDFSVLKQSVNLTSFIKSSKKMHAEEDESEADSAKRNAKAKLGTGSTTKKKKGVLRGVRK